MTKTRPDPSRRRACSRGCRFLDPAWIQEVRVPGSESQVIRVPGSESPVGLLKRLPLLGSSLLKKLDPSARIRVAGGSECPHPSRRWACSRGCRPTPAPASSRAPAASTAPPSTATSSSPAPPPSASQHPPRTRANRRFLGPCERVCVWGGGVGEVWQEAGEGGGDSGGICRRVRLTSARSLAPRERPPTVNMRTREATQPPPVCLTAHKHGSLTSARPPACAAAGRPPPMRNVDLRVEETSSSAEWLKCAARRCV